MTMSNLKSNQPSTGGRREALRQQQQAAAASGKRVSIAIRTAWIAGVAIIALLIGITVWSIAGARSGGSGVVAADGLTAPSGATGSGGVLIGKADAKVTVTIYADFMCPYCGQFDRANGEALATAVDQGVAKLEIHPMAFLDDLSAGTKYSTRAANAFVAVADRDPAAALKFYQLLYANQPAEQSAGLSDDKLKQLADEAGAPAEVTAAFAKQTFAPWVTKSTQQAFTDGIKGTPTVKINGQLFNGDLYTAGPLAAAISSAANG